MAFNISPRENRTNPYIGSIFEYGIVAEAYSIDHTVKLMMTNGQIIPRCKVISREWTAPSVAGEDFRRSGRRSLPPVNSRVVVLKPYYSYDGALVIGSDFVYDANYTTDDFASGGDSDKVEEDLHITPGGWEISESRKDGVITIVRGELELTLQDDGDGGINVEDQNGNKIAVNGDGIALEDTNGNKTVLSSDGIKVTDKNSNVVEMGSSSVKINNNLEVLQ